MLLIGKVAAMPSQLSESPEQSAVIAEDEAASPTMAGRARTPRSRHTGVSVLALPCAAAIAFACHRWIPNTELLEANSHFYSSLLAAVFVIGVGLLALQGIFPPIRRWTVDKGPIFAAGVLLMCLWDIITLKLGLLPLPYFPGPESILSSGVHDRGLLFDSTWHSLLLLFGGYAAGVVTGLFSGVIIGWSSQARYWGMPIVKIIGPIPATAWIPLAMVAFPSAMLSAVSLIALAVWFPVTMLTASGISNTRASYLDVARTLGAGRAYLILRVAIPAAMPSIFIGLFMGLGASFLTLVVAESIGVKSGLGWYVSWAQGWAEYGKVFAALVIMAAFFSTIMTLLFKLRDRVLAWQKGVIKW
jgi:NitT/TauT family transport system permease protein